MSDPSQLKARLLMLEDLAEQARQGIGYVMEEYAGSKNRRFNDFLTPSNDYLKQLIAELRQMRQELDA